MPNQPTIHIIPMAGLCNRMRAMASGVFVAKQLGRPAVVYWNKTVGCYARFDELFEPCSVTNVKVLEGGGI